MALPLETKDGQKNKSQYTKEGLEETKLQRERQKLFPGKVIINNYPRQ